MMNQGEKRFHKDVFLPKLRLPNVARKLEYTRHALNAAQDDKYGDLTSFLPLELNFAECELVECRLEGNRVTQLLLRVNVAVGLDLVLAVGVGNRVYTVWGNLTSDQHRTLNQNLYETKVA